MEEHFCFENFRPIRLEDRSVLEPGLISSPEQSCEFNFTNLFNWCNMYHSVWQDFSGLTCIWMESNDMLIVAETGRQIRCEDCIVISKEMKRCGHSGVIHHIRKETLERLPELYQTFRVDQMADEFGEYLYDVESLGNLHGEKLSKKRNMIAQFHRMYPNHKIVINSPETVFSARKLADLWYSEQDDPDSIELLHEKDALSRALDHWQALGMELITVLYNNEVIAFSMLSQNNADVWDEPFEKADRRFKGVSQLITSESAKYLIGRCRYLNREQDLGLSGLRQAKRSYMPAVFLKNYTLTPLF